MYLQTCGGDEKNNRDCNGERRRDGRALLPHSVLEVRANRHPHHRVRLHAKLLYQPVLEPPDTACYITHG